MISSNNDALGLANCIQYNGHVVVDQAASGKILLSGVQTITGNLTATGLTGLTGLVADELTTIGGSLWLKDLALLSELSFAGLAQADTVHFEGLPALRELRFTNGLSRANEVLVVDTALTNSSGLGLTTASIIEIYNNFDLETAQFDLLNNITSYLYMGWNGKDISISLPKLHTIGSLTLENATQLFIPLLEEVYYLISCSDCHMKNFSALNLKRAGNISFLSSDADALNLPSLEHVSQNIIVANNSELMTIALDELQTVEGDMKLTGSFDS